MKKWLTLLLVTGALSAAVEDRAGLFSAKAVTAANEQLGKVRTQTGKEILILTVNDLAGKKITEFARDEGRERRLNGMLVIISKNPRQLEVMAGRKTSLAFRKEHRDKLVEILSKNLRKEPDLALGLAVNFVTDAFQSANSALIQPDAPRPPVPAQQQSGSGGWLKWLIIIGVVFLVIRLVSYFMSRNGNAAAGTPGAPGSPSGFGGGGFFSSMLGGIFGAVAGNWIYDKFFGDSHNQNYYNQDSYRDSNQDWRNDDRGDFDSGSGSSGDWGGDGGSGSDGGGDSGGSW